MLTQIDLQNFKSWQRIEEMRFAPITGLFGPNSSGKTSILQWLLMLKQTAESADRRQVLNLGDERSLVELGTFHDILHQHNTENPMEWSLCWTLPQEMIVNDPSKRRQATLFRGAQMCFGCQVEEDSAGLLRIARMHYDLDDRRFDYARKEEGDGYDLSIAGRNSFRFKRTRGKPWPLPPPAKFYGFPDQVNNYFQNSAFLSDFQLALEQFLSHVYYLGPLREYPKRQYIWSGAEPADVGRRGEKVIDALLASRRSKEKISRGKGRARFTVEEYVAHWLKELELIHDFTVKRVTKDSNIYQVIVRKTETSAPVVVTDVGFGVSQVLPVLTICYYVPEGSTIVLEQPEIHLHPSVQAGLADVFIDAWRTRNVQIVVESHSEHLLRRLQRRIAEGEGDLNPEDVALYFCDMADGQSRSAS